MAYKIIVSFTARSDFDTIQDYLIANIGKNYADKVKREIIEKIKIIADDPLLYQIMDKPKYKKANIRRIPVEGYLIFYIVNIEQSQIEIARIRSDKQNNSRIKV